MQLSPEPGAEPGQGSSALPPNIASASPLLTTDTNIAAEAGVPQELLELPLRELIVRFGGLYGLERQAKILQQITTANDRYQKTQERAFKHIPKDFVQGRL